MNYQVIDGGAALVHQTCPFVVILHVALSSAAVADRRSVCELYFMGSAACLNLEHVLQVLLASHCVRLQVGGSPLICVNINEAPT